MANSNQPVVIRITDRTSRVAICKECPRLMRLAGMLCAECKCFVLAKASFEAADCPLNKWSYTQQ